jgi:hypothetical protein
MSSGEYLATAAKALAEKVRAPLRARGILAQEGAQGHSVLKPGPGS